MTPEEWAEDVVQVHACEDVYGDRIRTSYKVRIGEDDVWHRFGAKDAAEAVANAFRARIADAIRSAVAEALNSGMPGAPLTIRQLAKIRGRAEAATEGPWLVGSAAEGLHQLTCDWRCRNVWAGEGVDVTPPPAPDSQKVMLNLLLAPARTCHRCCRTSGT